MTIDAAKTNPVIMKYDLVKDKKEIFLSMTSLTVAEFDILCEQFDKELKNTKPTDGENSETVNNNGGRPSVLDLTQDKLFFILFYLKNYPLQETIGFIFGLSQPRANYWIHFLSGILKDTLEKMKFMPEGVPSELLKKLESEGKQDLSIDGTDRRINRPMRRSVPSIDKSCFPSDSSLFRSSDGTPSGINFIFSNVSFRMPLRKCIQ